MKYRIAPVTFSNIISRTVFRVRVFSSSYRRAVMTQPNAVVRDQAGDF